MKLKDKLDIYETFLHKISLYVTCCAEEGVAELVHNADMWSYAHRQGECVSDRQRDKMILDRLKKLCDTPNTDKLVKERQRKYSEKKHEEKSS